MTPVRARAVVRGRVQGVFFRAEASARARSLGLAGWVRNLSDGSVEVVIEGEGEHVDSMLRWCEHGPAGARVEAVDVTWEDSEGAGAFEVR